MHDLVELKKIIPGITLEILYASKENFTGKIVYPSARCFLRLKPAQRLFKVQQKLQKQGLNLKIWDGYRPLSVQNFFWQICPNPRYVADPVIGSRHNRGAAVDLTLVDAGGKELLMPTGFDDFSEKAHRNYRGGSPEALKNRQILEEAMVQEGFLPYSDEWWHFDDPDWKEYPILDVPFEELA